MSANDKSDRKGDSLEITKSVGEEALALVPVVGPGIPILRVFRDAIEARARRRYDEFIRLVSLGVNPADLPQLLEIPANAETFTSVYWAMQGDEEDEKARIYGAFMLDYLTGRLEKPSWARPLVRALKELSYQELVTLFRCAVVQSQTDTGNPNEPRIWEPIVAREIQKSFEGTEYELPSDIVGGLTGQFSRLEARGCVRRARNRAPEGLIPAVVVTDLGFAIARHIRGAFDEPEGLNWGW